MQALAEAFTCGAMTELARDDVLRMRRWRSLTDLHAEVTGASDGAKPPPPMLRQHVVECAGADAGADAKEKGGEPLVPLRFNESTRRRVTQ